MVMIFFPDVYITCLSSQESGETKDHSSYLEAMVRFWSDNLCIILLRISVATYMQNFPLLTSHYFKLALSKLYTDRSVKERTPIWKDLTILFAGKCRHILPNWFSAFGALGSLCCNWICPNGKEPTYLNNGEQLISTISLLLLEWPERPLVYEKELNKRLRLERPYPFITGSLRDLPF